jgi:LysR family nitrogen assimilation transcriptional regulator
LDLKQLEYFLRVAEVGSVTRAATLLSITQPSLSRQIRLLEVELRQTLLVRDGRGVHTTDAGSTLVKHARAMLLQADRARWDVRELHSVPMGRVVLGIPASVGRFLSSRLVYGFRERYPHASLSILEGQTFIMEWLSMGRIDVGLLLNPGREPGIETTPLISEPLYLVGASKPPGTQLRMGASVTLEELAELRLLLPCRPHAFRTYLESQLALSGRQLKVAWELDAFSTLLELVRKGFCYGIMPASVFHNDEKKGHYELRPIVEPELRSTVAMATHAERPVSPLILGLMELIREVAETPGLHRSKPALETIASTD